MIDEKLLYKRFEELVLNRPEPVDVSREHRRQIAHKFANKSLQELNEMVSQLPPIQSLSQK